MKNRGGIKKIMAGKITKLVLPVAGAGERLKPLTLKCPKALLKVGGKAILDFALEETKGTDIREVVLVVSPAHKSEFEDFLSDSSARFPGLTFYVRVQEKAFGNGDALLKAKDILGKDPFIFRLVDDLLVSEEKVIKSLSDFYFKYESPVLVLGRVPMEDVSRYGVVKIESGKPEEDIFKIKDFIEKPKAGEAPSNLIFVGGGVMNFEIVKNLLRLQGEHREVKDGLPITDAFVSCLSNGGTIYGWEFQGRRLDCGTLDGLEKANLFFSKN